MEKRILSAILAWCMTFALLPVSVAAEAIAPMGVSGEPSLSVANEGALHTAISQVEDGGTIILGSSIALTAAVTITEDNSKSFTFDLSGRTLSSAASVISHKGTGTLTITDSTAEKNGKLTTQAESSDTLVVEGSGGLVLESGTVEHAGTGALFVGAIHSSGYSGGVHIKGGTVRTSSGYAIISQLYAPLSITGGIVTAQNGVALYIAGRGGVTVGGTALITSANEDASSGTLVMAHFSPSSTEEVCLEITGGTVENTAARGNALTNQGYGIAEISGGLINGTGENGTGVLAYNLSLRETIVIKKGTPIIKGRGWAMSEPPLLEEDVQVLAERIYEGDSLADSALYLLFPGDLHRVTPFFNYKYLRFGPTTAVAKTGTKFYTALQDAFNVGASGSTIRLVADIALSQTVFNEKGKNFTLDLNGKTIGCRSGSVLFNAWGELIIADSSADKNGVIDGDIQNGVSKLTLAGGTVRVTGSNTAAIFSPARGGPIVIAGGTVRASGAGTYAIQNNSGHAVRVSGDAVICSESWWAISGKNGIVIEGGAIIKGGDRALNTSEAPSFDPAVVTVRASRFYEGTPATPYAASQMYSYKYLEFAPVPVENHDDQGFPAPGESAGAQNGQGNSGVTVWLSGSDLSQGDGLIARPISSGSGYNALVKLAEQGDILGIYDISLQSGRSATGGAMHLTFAAGYEYAGQALTLVHQKADGSFEYFHATADANGNVRFGPLYELSPFMLVRGNVPAHEVLRVPKTGDADFPLWRMPLFLSAICAALYVTWRRNNQSV